MKKPKKQAPDKTSALLPKLLLLALMLLVFSLSFFKISGDDDVFWHLASGRNIAENLAIPHTDNFSWPDPQQSWTSNSWLWDVISFLLFQISGYAGLCIFRTLIILAVFMIWARTLERFKIPAWLITLVLAGAAFGMMERFDPRPHITSFLFFTIVFSVLIRHYYFNERATKKLLIIPLVFLIWGNMHPSVFLGTLLLLIYTVSILLLWLKPHIFKKAELPIFQKNEVRNYAIIFVISAGAGLCNPSGIEPLVSMVSGNGNALLKDVYEWISPFHKMYSSSLMGIVYKVFLLFSLITIGLALTRRDVFAVLAMLAFAIYSTQSVRFSVDLYLVTPVFFLITIRHLGFLKKQLQAKAPGVMVMLLCLLMAGTVLTDKIYASTLIHRKSGIGLNESFYPEPLYEYIRTNGIAATGQRPFNTYECGGLFVWEFPGKKNFIDSRMANLTRLASYNKMMNKKPGFEKEFNEYNFDYAILFFDGYFYPSSELILNNMPSTIASYLFDMEAEWKLVYWDDRSFLFLRNNQAFAPIIKRDAYKYITPYNYLYRKQIITDAAEHDTQGLQNELNRKNREEPRGVISRAMWRNIAPLIP